MLVLTRKRMESIRIGTDIVIKVIDFGAKTVRLGLEAPPDVRILRSELTACRPANDVAPSDVPPFVADAVTDAPPADEGVVLGPMTAERFLAEFQDDLLPGRSIRRIVTSKRPPLTTAAK